MTKFFLKNKVRRSVSFTLLFLFVSEIIFPTASMALTNGPSQPEVQSFEPISTSDMVDVFTGDFKYNLPLLDVGGYPVNMSYNSGISMDQEASWVGLGWNLNVGNINRAMRGIPDDFKGEEIEKEMNMKPNNTFGLNAGLDFEVLGKEGKAKKGSKAGKKFIPSLSTGIELKYNNYTGFGIDLQLGIGISAGITGKGRLDSELGLHSSANEGLDIKPSVNYARRLQDGDISDQTTTKRSAGGKIGGVYNSRAGLKNLSFSANYNEKVEKVVAMHTIYSPVTDLPIEEIPEIRTLSNKTRASGSTVNFGLQTYMPSINMPMVNASIALSVKFGFHLIGNDANARFGGFFSTNQLAVKNKKNKAYGYMYSEYGQYDRNSMMDFNREKDGVFTRYTKNLPLTNFTYDVYNVTGQGSVSGAYRPFRSDVGHVFDNYSFSFSSSNSVGMELSGGQAFKTGVDLSTINVSSNSGKWTQENYALDYFKFRDSSATTNFEPYYFRQVGEKNLNGLNNALYNQLGGENAYAVRLKQGFSLIPNNDASIKSVKTLETSVNPPSSLSLSGDNYPSERRKRNQPFVTLTRHEAKNFGLQKNLYNTTGVTDMGGNNAMKSYTPSTGTIDHHIAEVNVLSADGSRYYYGLPVYNTKQEEFTFNVSGTTVKSNGLIEYSAADASVDNAKGNDNYYCKTKTPAYAYSYLLTAVVSSDYVDHNGNGPDDSDIGSYTKFHYKKSTGSSPNPNYRWQLPIDATSNDNPVANYNEGSKSNANDNMANVCYGEKELYYMDEIVTKNYVAKFITSDRKDSYGVTGLNGVIDDGTQGTPKSQRLDKIILYSKPDYQKQLANPTTYTAIPIKTVHFEYDYTLCANSPNNNGVSETVNSVNINASIGKLTLKRVYFTYGKSNRAIFNSYDFTYSSSNPNYHPKGIDRWGNYKPQGTVSYLFNDPRNNAEFPYVEQNKTNADIYANAWNLTKIKLPSGGEINVEYESDDYAFVQNMPAGQMFNVVNVVDYNDYNNPSASFNELLYSKQSSNYDIKYYLIVDGIDPSIAVDDNAFKRHYMKDLNMNGGKKMFFKFLIDLTGAGAPAANDDYYEYVSGYANVVDAGVIGSSGKGFILLNPEKLKKNGSDLINPIALAAIQFARLNYGNVAWDSNFNPPGDAEEALKQLGNQAAGALKTLVTGFKNPNKVLADKEYCSKAYLGNSTQTIVSKCQVRLYNPDGKKLGGGARVKKLSIDDNWDQMTTVSSNSQTASSYGQEYTYTTTDEFGRTISSGVASYEPMVGSEENSMKQPYYFGGNEHTIFAPDDRYYVEGPMGESFFPSPTVGYSSVKIRSILPTDVNLDYANGHKIYEFYTAKDYPTICKHTPLMPKQHRKPLNGLLKIDNRDYMSASQGYVVMTNDMHGKAKAEMDFAEGKDKPEKEVRFYYKTREGYKEPVQISLTTDASYSKNVLDNTIATVGKDGNAKNNAVGIDFDAIADFRESESTTLMVSAQSNVASFLVALIPMVVPTLWPSLQRERTRFRSAVVTKVINQYALLEKTKVIDENSTLTHENLAVDEETGDVLITRTTNNFDDPIYNVKYPAHWGYDLMAGAYKNVGVNLNVANLGSGNFGISNPETYFKVGDEVAITDNTTYKKAWVCTSSNSGSYFSIIDENGNPVTVSSNQVGIKVIRSANRNLIGSQMAVLTCMNNPLPSNLTTGGAITINSSSKILDAAGVQYSDQWQMPKGYLDPTISTNCNCTVTTTGTDLLNVLEELFNNKNNSKGNATYFPSNSSYYNCAFLNGGLTTPISTAAEIYPQTNGNNRSLLYKHANIITGDQYDMITTGFGTDPSHHNNYGLTTNLANQLPFIISSSSPGPVCNALTSPVYTASTARVEWYGPGTTANPNPFNSANQLIGAFNEFCNGQTICSVKLDFGPNFVWTTALQNHFLGLAQIANSNSVEIVPAAPTSQTSCYNGAITATFKIKNSVNSLLYSWPITISSDCLSGNLLNCASPSSIVNPVCGKLENEKVNPFFQGIKGNWRVKSNYTYLTDRYQSNAAQSIGYNIDIRKDGYFTSFGELYAANSGNNWTFSTGSGASKWVNTVETTKYNQYGSEVESKDALGRYSSAQYGYDEQYPVAVASNAQLRQVGYDGFEDYDFYYTCKKEHHFDFYPYKTSLDATVAHTGKYSMKVPTGQTYFLSKMVSASTSSNSSVACGYILKNSDFILPFNPPKPLSGLNNDYVISYWVKEAYSGSAPLDYTKNTVTVTKGSGAFAIKNVKRSAIIDGWQRIEYTFVIPNNYTGGIKINLKNLSSGDVYFDDIRVHPYNSNMKTFVYNPVNLRFVAELDANNFATFYEYDDQGNLIRVKKETERGIMTIKESKTHYAKP